MGRSVGLFEEQWLGQRLSATQAIAADAAAGEVDLDANQSMGPGRRQGEMLAKDGEMGEVIATSQIDDGAGGKVAEIQLTGGWQWAASNGEITACAARAPGADKAVAGVLERLWIGMMKAQPDFLLPQGIESLDEVLHAKLGRRCEHGSDVQGQAKPCNHPEDVRTVARALENRAVVKLHVLRPAMLLPEGKESLAGVSGGGVFGGPRSCGRRP